LSKWLISMVLSRIVYLLLPLEIYVVSYVSIYLTNFFLQTTMAKPKSALHKKVEEQNSSLKQLIERVVPERKKYSPKRIEVQSLIPKKN
jgi:Na+-transporting methylmalonyl-CoA/oxaloacetate decarboxylase gamma subunit